MRDPLVAAVLLLTVTSASIGQSSHNATVSSSYAAYSAFLKSKIEQDSDVKTLFVFGEGSLIAPHTITSSDSRFDGITDPRTQQAIKRAMPELQDETIHSLVECSGAAQSIGTHFSLPVRYVIATEQEIGDIERMYRNHPQTHGYFQFSCVGFNSSGNQALFYIQQLAYSYQGGEYVLMGRTGVGQWERRRTLLQWSLQPAKPKTRS